MSRPLTRAGKRRRRIEAVLLLAGVIAVGIWAWSYVRMATFQSWANRVLERQVSSRPATPSPLRNAPQAQAPPPIQHGALIGRLAIPRLKVRAIVREGASPDMLDVALGHIPGTALPGQPGNAGIAGHRDTLFRGLRNVQKNDVIEFQTPAADYRYEVETTGIVKPQDVGVLAAGPQREMTLVTCYPFNYVGSAPDRFIVKARLLDPPAAPAPVLQSGSPAKDQAPQPAIRPDPPAVPQGDPPAVRQGDPPAVRQDEPPAVRKGDPVAVRKGDPPAVRKVGFQVSQSHSRELVPGIRLGLSRTDAARRRASVWVFVTPERRTISLKNQAAHQAVYFHGHDDGRQRALVITQVTARSISGYLLLYGSARARVRPLRGS